MTKQQQRLVWDLPLRIFHWLLVVSVIASFTTGKIGSSVREYHMLLGYWMLGLLIFRLVWGVVGTRHSRFASFIPTPASSWRYARNVLKGEAPASIGHNPLGSLMVFLMLALLITQVVSGLFVDDDIFFAGPFAHAVRSSTSKFFEGLHHDVVNWIVVLAILHIAAALYHTFRMKEPLIRAMFTGRKSADVVPHDQAITTSAVIRALVVAAVTAAFVYWLVVIAPPPLPGVM
ncbi:MAG: cytochrome B [Gammaproteobacteria bacterium]|nr:cytochrome B [Gammaproteobacteria bacterium]